MSAPLTKAVWKICAKLDLTSSEVLVLLCLAEQTAAGTGECNPSFQAIAKQTHLQRRSVIRIINQLAADGAIMRGRADRGNNQYRLNPSVFLSSKAGDTEALDPEMPGALFEAESPKADGDTEAPPSGFDRWWALYPSHKRKRGEDKCRTKWKRANLEPETEAILKGLEWWIADWAAKMNEFVVGPHRFLNEEFWKAAKAAASAHGVTTEKGEW